jgi:hypothetical protein
MAEYVEAIKAIREKYQLEHIIKFVRDVEQSNPGEVCIKFGFRDNWLKLFIREPSNTSYFEGLITNKGKGVGSILRWVAMMVVKEFKLKLVHASINYEKFRQPYTRKGPPSWEIVSKAVKPNRAVFSFDKNPKKFTRRWILFRMLFKNGTPKIASEIDPNNIININNLGSLIRQKASLLKPNQ